MCYDKKGPLFQLVAFKIYVITIKKNNLINENLKENNLMKENIETSYLLSALEEAVQIDYKKACSVMEQA